MRRETRSAQAAALAASRLTSTHLTSEEPGQRPRIHGEEIDKRGERSYRLLGGRPIIGPDSNKTKRMISALHNLKSPNMGVDISSRHRSKHRKYLKSTASYQRSGVATYHEDTSTFGGWKPSISVGDSLALPGEDLSRIQYADRNIAQWRRISEYLDRSPHVQVRLEEAIRQRLSLDENDVENTVPM